MNVDLEIHHCTSSECTRPDDDHMVACDKCKRWWHYDCHNFVSENYDTVTPWFCEEEDCVFQEDSVAQGVQTNRRNSATGLVSPEEMEQNVNLIIEAATVAQATVAQRDRELLELRAELAATKLKLSKVFCGKEPLHLSQSPTCNLNARSSSSNKIDVIKKIHANHQALLSSTLKNNHNQRPNPSTLFREVPEKSSAAGVSSFQDKDMAALLTILNRNNVQELPSFSGENRKEWPYFEEVFKSTTLEGRFSSKENVARLRKALKGEAYHMVSDRLKYSSDADAIMDSLRTMFGRTDVLVHDLTSELLSLPRLSTNHDPKLRMWAVKINGFVADLKSMNREEDLRNGYVLTNFTCRLSAGLYQEWQKRKLVLGDFNLQQFGEFLTEKVINLPPDLLKMGPDQKNTHSSGVSKTSRVLLHQPASVCIKDVCRKCNKKSHALVECEEFLSLTPGQRQSFAKERSICFSCLDPSRHQWKACAKNHPCGVEGCNRRHHPLLHTQITSNVSLNSAAQPYVPAPHIHSSHQGADFSVMFKIVPIRIYGKGELFVDTFAFLDDGSSLSMIEEELFNELGLCGKPKRLTLQWTKGVSRIEDCMRTTLSVSGTTSRKKYELQNVYTIKNLGLASQSVDVRYLKELYPHLRGLPLTDLVDARPKILLGLDQAKFLLGHGQRR